MGLYWKDGYSADVEVYLEVDGKRYFVERIGPSEITIRDSNHLAAGTLGKLVMVVEGEPRSLEILLSQDCRAGSRCLVPFF